MSQHARADAVAVADRDGGGVAALTSVVIHAAENGGSQAPRQRIGGKCRRRLMSMLPCDYDAMTIDTKRIICWGEHPFRPSTLNTRSRTHNIANTRMYKCTNVRAASKKCSAG